MFIDNLAGQYVEKKEDTSFGSREINRRAVKDFKYLCSQSNLTCRDALGYVEIGKIATIGQFYIVGVEASSKFADVPAEFVDPSKENQYVAFVIYDGQNIKDVYVVKSSLFGGKLGLFSVLKVNAKKRLVRMLLKKPEKIEQYKFGHVLKDYL